MSETVPDEQEPDQMPDEQEVLILTAEESVWFMNLLMRPAREPTEALLRAAERHRELFGD